VFGVLSALATLNAFWPVRTPLLAIFGFFAGWLTIELALHSLVVHMVVLAWLCAGAGWRRGRGSSGWCWRWRRASGCSRCTCARGGRSSRCVNFSA
jgi:hypothetical protein